MLKHFLLLSSLVFLTACGGGGRSVLSGAPDSDKAVIIGKVILNPMVNDDGESTTDKSDDLVEHQIVLTKGDGSKRNQSPDAFWDEDADILYEYTPSGQFFALEIDPQNKISWNGLFFWIEHNSIFFADKKYSSNLRGFMLTLNEKLKPGKAYYMGTMKLDLSNKSFKEVGDEEYDRSEVQFIVPKRLKMLDEYHAAKKWFKKEHSATVPVVRGKTKKRAVRTESKFTETTVH